MSMFIKRLAPMWTSLVLMFVPWIVGAQSNATGVAVDVCKTGINDFTDFIEYLVKCLIGGLITRLIVALAVIAFMIGVVRFIWQAGQGNADYNKNLAKYLMWSVFALFIMLSVWGIIFLIGASLGIGQGGVAPIPQLPTS